MAEFNSSENGWDENKQLEQVPLYFTEKIESWFKLHVENLKTLMQIKSRLQEIFGKEESNIKLWHNLVNIKKRNNEAMKRYFARFKVVLFKYEHNCASPIDREKEKFLLNNLFITELFTSSINPAHIKYEVERISPRSLEEAFEVGIKVEDDEIALNIKLFENITALKEPNASSRKGSNKKDSKKGSEKSSKKKSNKKKSANSKSTRASPEQVTINQSAINCSNGIVSSEQEPQEELPESEVRKENVISKKQCRPVAPIGYTSSNRDSLQPLIVLKKIKENRPSEIPDST